MQAALAIQEPLVMGKYLDDFLVDGANVTVVGPGVEYPDSSVYYFATKLNQKQLALTIVDSDRFNLRTCEQSIDDFCKANKFPKKPGYVKGNAFELEKAVDKQDLIFFHDWIHMLRSKEVAEELIRQTQKCLSEKGKISFVFLDYGDGPIKDQAIRYLTVGYKATRQALKNIGVEYQEFSIVNDYSIIFARKPILDQGDVVYQRAGSNGITFTPIKRCNTMIVFGKES